MSPDIVPLEATQNIELETFVTDGSRGSAEVLGWGVAYEKHLSLGQADEKALLFPLRRFYACLSF